MQKKLARQIYHYLMSFQILEKINKQVVLGLNLKYY